MFRLNLLRCVIFQNFRNFKKLQPAAMISYQFKVHKPFYYPDRQLEMQRINEQLKSQLVTEAHDKKKPLPKDYHYKILGVRNNATTQQIKKAYYALAKRFHPDASNTPQMTKRFQEISNAYHILTDETKRKEYDQMGVITDEHSFLNNAVVTNIVSNRKGEIPVVSSEELAHMTNSEPKLELTFLEAAHGMKKAVEVRFFKKCPACNGKAPRLLSRSKPELCGKCKGTGQLNKKTQTYTSVVQCDQCQGKRYVNRYQCEACENRGVVVDAERIVVPVPPGTKTGDVLIIDNHKSKQRVSYRAIVKKSDYFERVGNDVHTEKYITLSEAILGTTCRVRGIHDDMELKIEPGTESHTKVVVKGKGIRTGDIVGNHVVTLKIRIPRQLSMKQRQLVLALAKTEEPTFLNAM